MNPTLKGQSAEVKAGFANGFGGGAVVGHNTSNHLGGEIQYMFQQHDLEASSGSTKVTKSGRSQAVHYDLLIYATGKKSRVRPFLAVGGGLDGPSLFDLAQHAAPDGQGLVGGVGQAAQHAGGSTAFVGVGAGRGDGD